MSAIFTRASAIDVALDEMRERADRLTKEAVELGAKGYVRSYDLPKVLPRITEAEISDESAAGTQTIIDGLERAIRADQNVIRSGWWIGPRNILGKRQALLAEQRALASLTQKDKAA